MKLPKYKRQEALKKLQSKNTKILSKNSFSPDSKLSVVESKHSSVESNEVKISPSKQSGQITPGLSKIFDTQKVMKKPTIDRVNSKSQTHLLQMILDEKNNKNPHINSEINNYSDSMS